MIRRSCLAFGIAALALAGPLAGASDQRIAVDASGFTASPWAYNGWIFAMSEDGDTYVIQPGPQFNVVAKNSLGEMTLATPAVSRGSLIIRTASKLCRLMKTRL